MQTRQPVFHQLLQVAFRLSQCAWLNSAQRYNVESCIRSLSDMARSRSIAIPSDLDNQVSSLFNKPAQIMLGKASKIFRSSRLQSAQLSRESSQSQVWLFLVFHPVNRLTVFFLHFSWASGSIGASSKVCRTLWFCWKPSCII